jgi:hypothetical protein
MKQDAWTLLLAIGCMIVTPALFVLILVLTDKYHRKNASK